MQPFIEYITDRLKNNGYKFERRFADLDLIMRSPDDKLIWICYLEVGIEPEQIRRMFDFTGHVLIVVNEKLIPDEIVSREETPQWLRILHGLWMGRIYVWNDRFLFGLHFDYDTGDISESGIIQPNDLLLDEYQTWLRGWGDSYRIARFYDKAWWTGGTWKQADARNQQQDQQYSYNTNTDGGWTNSDARQQYEQARDGYWKQQRERAQRTQYDSDGFAYDPNDWPGGKPPPGPTKRDFMREFAQAGNKENVKALYRELAKLYHPDLNPGIDTTELMQQVNAAYDRYR